ncbi:MAG: methyltransferase domain-containing protein [Patescibacteria group bacterium]|nr:methyltransferase domain-containing protein [Patescibacteria group bacterium]
MKKIEIGCGKKKREGYECCDVRDISGVNHVCRADELPFKNASIDEIYSRHLIEHFTLKEFIKTLSEWNRVLKVGGEVYIICPNLLWHLEQILQGAHGSFYTKMRGNNDRYWGLGSLFGWQQDEFDVHKFGYYFELLRDIFEDAGFEDVRDLTNSPKGLEKSPHHLEVSAKKARPFEKYTKSKFYTHFDVNH